MIHAHVRNLGPTQPHVRGKAAEVWRWLPTPI